MWMIFGFISTVSLNYYKLIGSFEILKCKFVLAKLDTSYKYSVSVDSTALLIGSNLSLEGLLISSTSSTSGRLYK